MPLPFTFDFDITNWYYSVNNATPGSFVFQTSTGLFVPNNNATFQAWCAAKLNFPINISAAADNGAGGTRLTVDGTNFGNNFSLSAGANFFITGTGAYDGQQTLLAVIDATHVDIAVAFAGTATGAMYGATVQDTLANLYSGIDRYNRQQILAGIYWGRTLATGATINLTNPLTNDIQFSNAGAAYTVNFPPVNVPGGPPIGFPIFVSGVSAGSNVGTINTNAGGLITTLGNGQTTILILRDNTSAGGLWDALTNVIPIPLPVLMGGTGTTKTNKIEIQLTNDQGSVTSGSFIKVNYNNKVSDPDGVFDAVTNFRYTPNVAGTFLICAAVHINITVVTSPVAFIISVYKNGAEYARGNQLWTQIAHGVIPVVSTMISMNGTTDFIEIFGFQNQGANSTFLGATAPGTCWLTAQRIGP